MNSYFTSQLISLSYMRSKLPYTSISTLKNKNLNPKSYINKKMLREILMKMQTAQSLNSISLKYMASIPQTK